MHEKPPNRAEVTPYALRVDPSLLGATLARPRQRAVAILVDVLAIVVLANAPSVIFGLAAAFVLWKASSRPATGGLVRRSFRNVARIASVAILFPVAVSLWNVGERLIDGSGADGSIVSDDFRVTLSGPAGLVAGAEMLAFTTAGDEAEARNRAERLSARLSTAGFSDEDVLDLMEGLAGARSERPWLAAAVDSLGGDLRSAEIANQAEQLTRVRAAEGSVPEYAQALVSGDSVAAARLRAELVPVLAADTLRSLESALLTERERAQQLEDRLADSRDEVEAAREPAGLRGLLRNLREDLGLGLGWSGLYFTAFLVLWRGQTPGKRLVGIRVVRLDRMPIGWWAAFERFGGYAAGFATGLLGFLQVFWDGNRQAVHDKISATVVVDERNEGAVSGAEIAPSAAG